MREKNPSTIPYIDNSPFSGITTITKEKVGVLDPRIFQEFLRARHIIIVDIDLPLIPCNRRGLLTLNGLKEIVKMEGIKVALIYRQYIDWFIRPFDYRLSDV